MNRLLRDTLSTILTLLLSLGLAILIWIQAQQQENPIRNQLLEISVNFVGQPTDSILVSPTTSEDVLVSFSGPTSIVSQLTADDFYATIDLSQVAFGEDVEVDIQVQPNNPEVTILFVSPEKLTIHLEQSITRQIPIELDIRGSVARGHTQGEPLIDPEFITVSGIASQVDALNFARVTIFLNNERETKVDTLQPIFYNQQGQVASLNNLTISTEEVNVTVPINETAGFAEKLITVNWTGNPAPGYRLLNVSVDPPSVLINGRPTQVNLLTSVLTEAIDVTGLTESFRQQVTLALPDGISLDEVQEIFVEIEIEPILSTNTYNQPVTVSGLATGLQATIQPEQVRVVLFGPLPILDALAPEEIKVTADLFGLDIGTYSLPLDVDFPDRGIELRSIQPTLITVNITNSLPLTDTLPTPTPTANRNTNPADSFTLFAFSVHNQDNLPPFQMHHVLKRQNIWLKNR